MFAAWFVVDGDGDVPGVVGVQLGGASTLWTPWVEGEVGDGGEDVGAGHGHVDDAPAHAHRRCLLRILLLRLVAHHMPRAS